MRRILGILAIGGGLILISWVTAPSALTPASGPRMSAADIELTEQTARAVAPLATQVDDQAARLRARLTAPPPKPQPDRNPFKFRGTSPSPDSGDKAKRGTYPVLKGTGPAETGYVPLAVPPSPTLALPSLVAITSDARDGGLFRTAVLSIDDEMRIVNAGQMFDRFLVEAIGPDSIRIVDITSPARRIFTILIR